ncbi:hypothetical protein LXM94_25615 [Rhizobium sp. TRM95111]|uniref:hypothetical protein n=1 Tax=Rhizobium alarense TaxID=2846851 RepID=UPI001F2781D3|nr:hypothetical protein [Rhizobium alarense]MCF3643335.1 hypothetical protein [Rhizobium alarense]
MKTPARLAFAAVAAALTGCATGPYYSAPYYSGSVGYRAHNIGGMPVSGSVGVSASRSGVMVSPNIVISPSYYDWKTVRNRLKNDKNKP